ncbi:uncharacterized protein FA14DRAFT_181034 [Meira miltonrushii]|uniref:RING-type domain-containing protein n=1 Tax=Meira miltonrushii TaxID=1280837 RepID=A0A316VAD7_9BASI|nr:uncharacterized protein FA14DRAFT_181034 [Meira miltonrushii]PWN34410.1 hypothetical protein FA14DRAFT_181034 [Meira miltonrushii]
MDESLRCNSLPCRKPLQAEGRAVSTSCSHIFCFECATNLLQGRRICPACSTPLENQDDAVVTSLNPSASYKASVLAGLSPQIIMEICTRAIAFHNYQSMQESAFQQMLLKKAQASNSTFERELNRIQISAKTEVNHLEAKVQELTNELAEERRKTRELHDILRSTGRDYENLKTQFDQSRRKAIRSDLDQITAIATPKHARNRISAPQPFFPSDDISNDPIVGLRTPSRTLGDRTNIFDGQARQTPNRLSLIRANSRTPHPTPAQPQPQPPPTFFTPGVPKSNVSNVARTPSRRQSDGIRALGSRTPIRPMPLPTPRMPSRQLPRQQQKSGYQSHEDTYPTMNGTRYP